MKPPSRSRSNSDRVLDDIDDETDVAGLSILTSGPNPSGANPNLTKDTPNQARVSYRKGAVNKLNGFTENIPGAVKPSVSKTIPNLKRVRAPLKENRKPLPSLARVSPTTNFDFSLRAVPNLTRITALNPASREALNPTPGETLEPSRDSLIHPNVVNPPETTAQNSEVDRGPMPNRNNGSLKRRSVGADGRTEKKRKLENINLEPRAGLRSGTTDRSKRSRSSKVMSSLIKRSRKARSSLDKGLAIRKSTQPGGLANPETRSMTGKYKGGKSQRGRSTAQEVRRNIGACRDVTGLYRLRSDGTSRSLTSSDESFHAVGEPTRSRTESGELPYTWTESGELPYIWTESGESSEEDSAPISPSGSRPCSSSCSCQSPAPGPSGFMGAGFSGIGAGFSGIGAAGREEIIGEMSSDDGDVDYSFEESSIADSEDDSSAGIRRFGEYGNDIFLDQSSDFDELEQSILMSPSSRLHRCTQHCPFGCRGNHRPNEIVIFESTSTRRLKRPGQGLVTKDNPVIVDLHRSSYRRLSGHVSVRRRNLETSSSQGNDRGLRMPQRVKLVYDQPEVSDEVAVAHTWNPADRSFNVRIRVQDPFTIRREPVAQSTDSARTSKGYSTGLHVFSVTWPLRQRGTHATVGVSTAAQTLHTTGYCSLIGLTEESWGWDLGRLKAYHNSASQPGVQYPAHKTQDFCSADTFHLVLDCDGGTLGFISGGEWLGVAHTGLQGKVLYPTISGVWGYCEVKLRYHGGLEKVPRLSELCRTEVRRACSDFSTLPLPRPIKKFLNHL